MDRPDQPPAEDCSDLEYDLAHEAVAASTGEPPARRAAASTYVITETAGYDDGDYGYDLAHDIPKPERYSDRPGR